MITEIIKTVLTVLGTVIVGRLVYQGQKFIRRSSDQATKDDRDAAWNAAYRNGAEGHMQWDFKMLRAMERLQTQFNELEAKLGIEQTDFPELDDPPALFPHASKSA